MAKSGKCDDSDQAGEVNTGAACGKQAKSPSPKNCRNFTRRQFADAMPSIITTFVEKAKDGSVQHFASLTKFGGFDQKAAPSDAPKKRRKTLARQFLEEVELYEAKQAAELAAANAADAQTDNEVPQERS